MTNNQIACDPHRIELFLQQKLTDDEQSAFELHLDDCHACRRQLETSAAGDDAWSAVRDSLRDPPILPSPFGRGAGGEGEPDNDSALDSAAEETSSSQATILKLLAPTDDDRMIGRWGTYEVVGVVGTGGMGVVLKAFDAALNRYVAIKILAPHLGSSGAAIRRFSREGKAAAAVVHDNVIEIYGVSEAAGLPYLVMPYVRGPSLQRRLDDEGPLAVVEILRIAMQAAVGLAAAHAQGLVHRDVKPANILLADGIERVKLTDFGLARAADDASLTRTGVIAGTPQYMSPEQARGEPVDRRSDLFSLGSVLYAMCTGRPPFRAETSYGVLRRITDEEPRPIREINPDIPDWLCGIVTRLMAKQPEDRLQSANEVAALLEQCLAHVQQPTAVPLPKVAGIPARRDVPSADQCRPEQVRRPEQACAVPAQRNTFTTLCRNCASLFRPTSTNGRKLLKGTLLMLALIGISLFAAGVVSTSPPDISGNWQGEDWGQVTLTQTAPGEYTGTYTDTVAKEKGPGKIDLKWSRIERRFNGTWREGDDERLGDLSVHLVDKEIRGALTTDAKSKINPATPRLADLSWTRAEPVTAQPGSPTTWDVAKDFSTTRGNPHGAWTYGMVKDSKFVPYTLRKDTLEKHFDQTELGEEGLRPDELLGPTWYGSLPEGEGNPPSPSGLPLAGLWRGPAGLRRLQPGQFYLHAGPLGEASVARWTAPQGLGPYVRIQGQFLPGDIGVMQVGIFLNGVPQVAKPYWHASDSGRFDILLSIAAGATIDFAVYGGCMYGTTPLEATITNVPATAATPEIEKVPGAVSTPGSTGQVIPPSLLPGSRYQLLLITGGSIQATSSDIKVYNDFAAAQITNPALTSLGVSWKALVSTPSVSARKNAPTSTLPIYNTRGQLIALNSSDLWDSAISASILDQYGQSDQRLAWTGTSPSGEPYFGPWSLGGGGGFGGVGPHVAVMGEGAGGGDLGTLLDWRWVACGLLPWTDRLPVFALSTPITVLTREKEKAQGTVPPHPHAIQFDGNHYAKIEPPPKFTASDFTISLWFNPTTAARSKSLFHRGFSWSDVLRPYPADDVTHPHGAMHFGRDYRGDINMHLNIYSGELDFAARTANHEWLFGWDVPESRLHSPVHYGQWNHVVVTRRGDSYTMWMNGARINGEKSPAQISDTDNTNPFLVGGMMEDDGGARDIYHGSLDDFRIFRRCLSDQEIADLYKSGGDETAMKSEGRVKLGPLCAAEAIQGGGTNAENRSDPLNSGALKAAVIAAGAFSSDGVALYDAKHSHVVDISANPDGPWSAKLPDDVTVELAGVGGENRWWQPDGSPTEKSLHNQAYGTSTLPGNHVFRTVLLRVNNPSSEPVGITYAITSNYNLGGHPQLIAIKANPGRISDVAFTAIGPAAQRTVGVRVGIGSGAWQEIASREYDDGQERRGNSNSSGSFTHAVESKDGIVVVSRDRLPGSEVRVVAIQAGGKQVEAKLGLESWNDDRQITATLPGVRLGQVRKIALQHRPYKWIEFRNVVMQATTAKRVSEIVSRLLSGNMYSGGEGTASGAEVPWGEWKDGLSMRLRPDKTVWTVGETPQFTLDIRRREVDQGKKQNESVMLNVGSIYGGLALPAARLVVVDSKGKSKELACYGPPIAGNLANWLVPLSVGSTYSLRLRLADFCCMATLEFPPIVLAPGEYRVFALLKSNVGFGKVDVWKGTLATTPIPISIVQASAAVSSSGGETHAVVPSSKEAALPIAGVCRDDQKRPIAGASAMLYLLDHNPRPSSQTRLQVVQTDREGRFTFAPVGSIRDSLQRRDYAVIVTSPHRVTVYRGGIASRRLEHLEFTMPESGSLRGKVTDPNGRPVEGAQVSAPSILPQLVEGIWAARTDSSGEFEIADLRKIDPAKFPHGSAISNFDYVPYETIFIRHSRFAPAEVKASSVPGTVNVTLKPPAVIEGRVVNGKTDEPAAGVRVCGGTYAITDSKGRYRLEPLGAGDYAIWAEKDGWTVQGIEAFHVGEGETKTVPDMRLIRGQFFVGQVIDADTGRPIRPLSDDRLSSEFVRPEVVLCTGPSGRWFPYSAVEADGSFRVRVAPGANNIFLRMPESWTVVPPGPPQPGYLSGEHQMWRVADDSEMKVESRVRYKGSAAGKAAPVPSAASVPSTISTQVVRDRVSEGQARPASVGEGTASGAEVPWGEWKDGLSTRLRPDKAVWTVGETPHFTLDIRRREVDQGKKQNEPTTLNLGLMAGSTTLPTAVRLVVVDSKGKWRELSYYHMHPAKDAVDWFLQWSAGSTYSFRLRLVDFWCEATMEAPPIALAPGQYRLLALVDSNLGISKFDFWHVWDGMLASAPVTISIVKPSAKPESQRGKDEKERQDAASGKNETVPRTPPPPTGRAVTGRVLTVPGGNGVTGATVCLMRGWEANSIVTARTAADGTYTFHDVQPAEHYKTWIEAAPGRPAGVWSENDEFDVLQHDVRAYDHLFLKHPQSVAGTVRDAETGQPIAGAMIRFSMMDGKRRWIATDAQGRYRLYVLARNVTLRCDGSDRYSADSSSERRVAVEDNRETTVDFRCASGAPLTGRVVNPDGTPAKKVCVGWGVKWPGRADGTKGDSFDGPFGPAGDIATDGDGRFSGYMPRPFGRDSKARVTISAWAWPPDGSMAGYAEIKTSADKPFSTPFVVRLKKDDAPEGLMRDSIVWGKRRDGIEYGVKLLGPNPRRIGEHVRLALYARNPGESLAGVFAYRDGRVKGWIHDNAIYLCPDIDMIGSGSFIMPGIHLSPKEEAHLGTGRFLLVPPDFAGNAKGEAILRVKPGKYPLCYAAGERPEQWRISLEVEAAGSTEQAEADAKRDLQRGSPKYYRIGKPIRHSGQWKAILKREYGVELVDLGCIGSEYADKYNAAVLGELTKRDGADFLAKSEAKAIREEQDSRAPASQTNPKTGKASGTVSESVHGTLSSPPNTTSAASFQPLDCVLVDEKTGAPVPGNDFAISLRYVIPGKKDRPWQLVDEVFLGPNHPGTFKFTVPDKVLQHPDRDLILVEWTIVHPRLDARDEHDPIRVNEILNDDPRTARQSIRRIKMHDANIRKGQRPEHFDEFTARVQLLQNQDVQKVGWDALVKGYEQLLKDHPAHPDRAGAMLALASLWQVTNPGLGIKPDPKEEIRWLREACKSAAEGRDEWFDARFRLVGAIYSQHPDEARRILDDLLQHAPDSIVKVKSLVYKQMIAVDQKQFQEAEAIFLRLQNWDIGSNDMPKELFKKGQVFEQIQDSARLMMFTTAGLNIPKAERKAKIEELLQKCHLRQSADRSAEAALQYMEGLPDVNR